MKQTLAVFLCACLASPALFAQKEDGYIGVFDHGSKMSGTVAKGVAFPMKYEGGSLALNQHDKLKTTIASASVIMSQGEKQFEIPAKSITEVSYGADVHRRVGQAIGVALVSFGIGAMLLLVKTKKHYVGMTWKNPDKIGTPEENGGVVFKVGKGDYRGFLAALEGKSGLKAVNADIAGPGGTSK
jgi:hypothetical protein